MSSETKSDVCPICGELGTYPSHHCSPKKLANIERGRLTELARQEQAYRREPSIAQRIELGFLLLEQEDTDQ